MFLLYRLCRKGIASYFLLSCTVYYFLSCSASLTRYVLENGRASLYHVSVLGRSPSFDNDEPY